MNTFRKTLALLGIVTLVTSGCASYSQLRISDGTALKASVAELITPAYIQENHSEQVQFLDLESALSLSEIAVLVAINNPDLKAERAKLAIGQAQVLDAGLFPDPQMSFSFDHPTNAGPLDVNGWGVGAGYDITALLNRKPRLVASQEAQKQIALDVLWQEWLTVQQAQFLAVKVVYNQQRLTLLEQMKMLYEERYGLSDTAVKAGDITLDVSGTNLTALLDVSSNLTQTRVSNNSTIHALKLALGLRSDASVNLQRLPPPPEIQIKQFNAALQSLPSRRPDLLALKAGVQSQDAKFRAAIRAQFPALNLGFNRLKDTAGLHSTGIGLNFSLPVFSRNRGQIAITKASRAQLRDAYYARLANAHSQTNVLMDKLDVLKNQQDFLGSYLPQLKMDVDKTRRAFQAGDLDALTFLNLEATWVSKKLELINLQEARWESLLALQTMLALRPITSPYLIEEIR